jgi:predicted phosphodiesterase
VAKFLFWSDLHCEFRDFSVPEPQGHEQALPDAPSRADVDAILIAGDTNIKARGIELATRAWEIWRKPVLMVGGNHEGYGAKNLQKSWRMEDELIAAARARGADIQMMRSDVRVIGDTRIIAATLWTDLRLLHDDVDRTAQMVRQGMNDYHRIRFYDDRRGIYRRLLPEDTLRMHQAQKKMIFDELSVPFDGRTIVMTHHVPIREMLCPEAIEQNGPLIAAYASDLAAEIARYKVDAWICGHHHESRECTIEGDFGPIRFLRNIRGYPDETTEFNPVRVLDSAAPQLALPAEPSVPEL